MEPVNNLKTSQLTKFDKNDQKHHKFCRLFLHMIGRTM